MKDILWLAALMANLCLPFGMGCAAHRTTAIPMTAPPPCPRVAVTECVQKPQGVVCSYKLIQQ